VNIEAGQSLEFVSSKVWHTSLGGSVICDKVWQGRRGQNWSKIAWCTLWMAPCSETKNVGKVLSCKTCFC